MPRYRLTLEYDGGPFVGFQAQAELPTVQGEVERAIEAFCGERVRIHAAGRTDTGVHATGQVIHVDLTRAHRPQTVMNALNAHLVPAPIAVTTAEVVGEDFHARFSATGRRYLYRILNRRAPPALERGRVWLVKSPLDAEAMSVAARSLVGLHDFTTFRDAACQAKSPVKTLDVADVVRVGEEVRLTFAARSFLHRQVRSMVGSLAEVGRGRWTPNDLAAALAARSREACGPVAPAEGLCLVAVEY
ncbi:MAG TPA: tRNA pseudouridine(38-40) synthase TruA [Caulobacteraceae bacterium]|nr:tRNA pseudouridine(38-40) synthase TruA [Caulobacteraceae bacterium]